MIENSHKKPTAIRGYQRKVCALLRNGNARKTFKPKDQTDCVLYLDIPNMLCKNTILLPRHTKNWKQDMPKPIFQSKQEVESTNE